MAPEISKGPNANTDTGWGYLNPVDGPDYGDIPIESSVATEGFTAGLYLDPTVY